MPPPAHTHTLYLLFQLLILTVNSKGPKIWSSEKQPNVWLQNVRSTSWDHFICARKFIKTSCLCLIYVQKKKYRWQTRLGATNSSAKSASEVQTAPKSDFRTWLVYRRERYHLRLANSKSFILMLLYRYYSPEDHTCLTLKDLIGILECNNQLDISKNYMPHWHVNASCTIVVQSALRTSKSTLPHQLVEIQLQ